MARPLICENDVFLGPSMVFTNITNPRSAVIRRDSYEKTIVSKGASIGANATIVCGNNIGAFALIGAGAVVTKDVKSYSLIVGNPATFRFVDSIIQVKNPDLLVLVHAVVFALIMYFGSIYVFMPIQQVLFQKKEGYIKK